MAQWLVNLTSIHEDRSLALVSRLKRCGVGHRCSLDPALLWLVHGAAATALTQPLDWEPLYAMGVALKRQKRQKKTKTKTKKGIYPKIILISSFSSLEWEKYRIMMRIQ